MYYHRLIIYFDGASRHNPHGPAGCGWSLYEMNDDGADAYRIARGQKYLGYHISNNQAEYSGLEDALDYLICNNISCNGLYIRGDSEVVIKQLEGEYRVNSPNITGYYDSVMDNLSYIDKNFVVYRHVARSRNFEADSLANDAINERESYNLSN